MFCATLGSVTLTRAIEKTGKAYEEIGQLFGAQVNLSVQQEPRLNSGEDLYYC